MTKYLMIPLILIVLSGCSTKPEEHHWYESLKAGDVVYLRNDDTKYIVAKFWGSGSVDIVNPKTGMTVNTYPSALQQDPVDDN